MLKISTEFRKGVLFVRLLGQIENDKYLESINNLVEYVGIKFVVLNIENIKKIDVNNISDILKYNNKIKQDKRHLLICDANKRSSIFEDKISKINCEIDAFNFI